MKLKCRKMTYRFEAHSKQGSLIDKNVACDGLDTGASPVPAGILDNVVEW